MEKNKCSGCNGIGMVAGGQCDDYCPICNGTGYIERINNMREFSTGATRNDDSGKVDYDGFLSPLAIRRFGQYMHKHRKQADGKLRDSDNWQKGIPQKQYRKSLFRHFIDFWSMHRGWIDTTDAGEDMEELLCAILFNTQGLLHEIQKGKTKPEKVIPAQLDIDILGSD